MKRIVTFIMAVIMIVTLANPSTVDAAAKLNKKKVTLSITDKKKNPSVTLKVKGTSKKAAKKAKWTTSNKKVVKISKGKITAKKPGKATITCKVGKKKLKCNVTVVDKRKAVRTSEENEEDEELYDPCPAGGNHEWVAHWVSYDKSGSYKQSEVVDHVCSCNCGYFLSEAEKEAHWFAIHSGAVSANGIWHGMGLHDFSAQQRAHGTREEKLVDGELVTYWTLHTDYINYEDCTKCGEHIATSDVPEAYGL